MTPLKRLLIEDGAVRGLGQGVRQRHRPRSEADLDQSIPDDAPEREMVADLRRYYRRSDRDRPPQLATTAENGRPTGIQPPRLATGSRVHADSHRRRIAPRAGVESLNDALFLGAASLPR